MRFNSYTFIIFFLISLGLHHLPFTWRIKKLNLLFLSQIFYAAWNPPFIILMWFSATLDWYVSYLLSKTENSWKRTWLMSVSLLGNLGLLGYFKYANFLVESINPVFQYLGLVPLSPIKELILPAGISFYTFQTLSYTIDVYRRDIPHCRSFTDYFLYVSFFPQLVAGPIVRAVDFLGQCKKERRVGLDQFLLGIFLFVFGLFEKVVIADTICAPITDRILDATVLPSTAAAWAGVCAFAIQVFADFAGYSTCAVGLAKCLGFDLMINFDHPYAPKNFSNYWRRWHISLSNWLRDYVYIPMGGNRKGKLRGYFNLIVTMWLGGLWHGASWNYVAWGFLHGSALAVERAFNLTEIRNRAFQLIYSAITLIIVFWIYTFFRVHDLAKAFAISKIMLGYSSMAQVTAKMQIDIAAGFIITGIVVGVHCFFRNRTIEQWGASKHWLTLSIFIAFMLFAISTSSGVDRAFIYFQF